MKYKPNSSIALLQRNILVGAALGLYYGLFYRPSGSQPDYAIALGLGLLAAGLTVLLRNLKKKPGLKVWGKEFLAAFFFFSIFLLALAFRYQVQVLAGRIGVAVFTTLMGMAMGYILTKNKIIG